MNMPQRDAFILMVMGGLFILLGLALLIWGKIEEKRYYNAVAARTDMREFLEHEPKRPEPGAQKVGGWIAIAVGLVMIVTSGIFLLFS